MRRALALSLAPAVLLTPVAASAGSPPGTSPRAVSSGSGTPSASGSAATASPSPKPLCSTVSPAPGSTPAPRTDCVTPTPEPADTATPTATTTPQRCPGIVRVLAPQGMQAGRTGRLEVQLTSPTSLNRVRLVREDPGPVAEVRSTTADLTASFEVRLGESHRFRVRVTRDDGVPCDGHDDQEEGFHVPVGAAVSVTAVRSAPRDYVFSGRVVPGHGTVALWRVEDGGRRVLTARAEVVDGRYRIDRRLLGSGRFGFVVVVDAGSSGRHAGGASRVRPTLVH